MRITGYTKNDIFYTIFGFCFGYCVMFWMTISQLAQKPKSCSRQISTTAYNYEKPDKAFLLVAVMTTRRYLNTRARYVHETWGHQVPGDILYFVGGDEPYTGNLPVITLNHIKDTSYPPQTKSFSMIKYVADNLRSRYEWFMRADDDLFIKTWELEKFLRTINSSKTLYIGQPGFGLKHERANLSLHGPYCMGGPGILMTQSTLHKVSPHIVHRCLEEAVTAHEDTELGRCIRKYVGVQCTYAYEIREIFVHNNYDKYTQYNKSIGGLEKKALTLHPIKIFPHMYRLDAQFSALKVKQLQQKLFRLNTEMDKLEVMLNKHTNHQKLKKAPQAKKPNKTTHKPRKSTYIHKNKQKVHAIKKKKPKDQALKTNKLNVRAVKEDTNSWDLFNKDHRFYSMHNLYSSPHIYMTTSSKYKSKINAEHAVKYGSKFKYPLKTLSYVRLTHGKHAETVSIKRGMNRTLLLERTTQHLAGVQFYDLKVKDRPPISIILPVYKKSKVYKKFVSMISKVMTKYRGQVNLVTVLHYDTKGEYLISKQISEKLTNMSPNLTHKLIFLNETFSRGLALSRGIAHLPKDTLLLFMDVDMIFNEQFLYRVQVNTIYRKQVYFPISFSHYNPQLICLEKPKCQISPWNIGDDYGMWRLFGFGMVSVYKGDYVDIGGYNLNIKGWGEEDEEFYDKSLRSRLRVFRAIDPTLVHLYHKKFCDTSLPRNRFYKCQLSRAIVLGNTKQLTTLVNKLGLVKK